MIARTRQVALLALLPAAMAAQASPTVVTNVGPGGYIAACGGVTSSSTVGPGGDTESLFQAGGSQCHAQSFAAGGSAHASAAFSNGSSDAGPDYSSDAQGSVAMGVIKLAANNVGASEASFPLGRAAGGWEDTLTISSPDPQLNGKPGILSFDIAVHAVMDSKGPAGATSLVVDYFKNDQQSFLPGGISGAKSWGISTFPLPDVNQDSLTVDEIVHFSVGFNFGTAFDLGIFAQANAGMRSQGSSTALSTTHIDALNTIRWLGVAGVKTGENVPVTNFTLMSGSGIDWLAPTPVPLPAGLPLLGGALAALGLIQRRRRAG